MRRTPRFFWAKQDYKVGFAGKVNADICRVSPTAGSDPKQFLSFLKEVLDGSFDLVPMPGVPPPVPALALAAKVVAKPRPKPCTFAQAKAIFAPKAKPPQAKGAPKAKASDAKAKKGAQAKSKK